MAEFLASFIPALGHALLHSLWQVALIGLFVLGGLAPARRRRLHRVAAADVEAAAPRSMALATGAVVLIGLAVAAAALSLR